MKNKPISHQNNAVRIIRHSPIGPIAVEAGDAGLVRITILAADAAGKVRERDGSPAAREFAELAVRELERYFSGELTAFSLPVDLSSLTEFQRAVLKETARIPFGQVRTYGEVAGQIGRPNSARAVGGALSRNPITIMIPCHRVVAHNGKLHGFSSPDGIFTKAKLLQHEGLPVRGDRVAQQ